MTQEPSQSWPRRDSGPDADRPMAFDPLTGEPIPAPPVSGVDLTKPDQPTAGAPEPEPDGGYLPPVDAGRPGYGPAGYYGAAGYPPPGYAPPGYGPAAYPPPGYGMAPYPPAYPVTRPTNGLAIASLVLGAVWMFWVGSVLALVLGYVARGQIRRTGEGGDGVAVAGIVLGWVGVGFLVLVFLLGALGNR